MLGPMNYLVTVLLIVSLASCATSRPRVEAKSARLYDEQPNFTMIDNERSRGNYVLLTPGKHRIRRNCTTPPSPDNTLSSVASTPPIEYVFEGGVEYRIRCEDGRIVVFYLEY